MGLWNRLFGRKPQVVDRRQPNDWKAGDLAVCINDDWEAVRSGSPKAGDIRRVTGITDDLNVRGTFRCYFLWFGGDTGYESAFFRKAEEDHAPAEAEFTALIKRPVRKRERA